MKSPIAIEHGTGKSAFGVVVPDLPGCFSAGDTLDEALENTRQAILTFCALLKEDHKDIPAPKGLIEWEADPQFKGWDWHVLDV